MINITDPDPGESLGLGTIEVSGTGGPPVKYVLLRGTTVIDEVPLTDAGTTFNIGVPISEGGNYTVLLLSGNGQKSSSIYFTVTAPDPA